MTVAAGGEVGEFEIDPKRIMVMGIVGGFVGVYLVSLNILLNTTIFSFFAGIGAIMAIMWGADQVSHVSKYGLGTGVPSIGILAIGMGIIATLFGLSISYKLGVDAIGPVIGFLTSCAIGAVIGYLVNRFIELNVPILVSATLQIAGAASLTLIALMTAVSGSYYFLDIVRHAIDPGFVALILIISGLAILNPFNACLGPDERQSRTITLAKVTGAIAMILAGIAAIGSIGLLSGFIILALGIALWIVFFMKFWELTKRDAFAIWCTGLLPEEEE